MAEAPSAQPGPGPLTPAERAAYGRAVRSRLPRSAHARFSPGAQRPEPLSVLEHQSAERVPELVPIRYGRMLESPFRFYRGAAAIMAADLGSAPHTQLTTQLCGDAHLLNFRLLASPERHLVFDINDFDETLPGPFEWDVKRLAASLVIAARARGFDERTRASLVLRAVRAYRERMHEFSGMRTLDIWYAQDDADRLRTLLPDTAEKDIRKRTEKAMAKARGRDNVEAYGKLTRVVDGERRIAPDPPLITPLADLLPGADEHPAGADGRTGAAPGGGTALEQTLRRLIAQYALTLPSERRHLLGHFRVADMARKVVGVGSVGTRCWLVLLLGRDDDDPLLLQAKEAGESVLAPYVAPGRYENQGERVVAGQRLMQAAGDIFLGWERVVGIDGRQRDFYVRQLHDWKGIARPDTMTPAMMRLFAGLCGASLARAHARSGDPIAIAAYLGASDSFDRALAEFAEAYADQNQRDYDAFAEAVHDGSIPARAA
ncbi:DUF2252 domain-containing protein [Streptomyces sp. GC420]|uniref:DUF2252 domain-containing protein n=1 Tax=Streptomyces sp. GC420 TaxID=2697568 RepID=UPI001414E7EA|nr:DUF2252 domain-containing protein [Streptomyces sp. GC420]NBM17782.1 DUF2252 domain-containing protein [Streptomyces sp. GC420]